MNRNSFVYITCYFGLREHAVTKKINEAHRRVMVANHPDAGKSHYLASKINEAKDILMGNTKALGIGWDERDVIL